MISPETVAIHIMNMRNGHASRTVVAKPAIFDSGPSSYTSIITRGACTTGINTWSYEERKMCTGMWLIMES